MKQETLRTRGTGRLALEEVRQHPDRERMASAIAAGISEPMIAWARRINRCGTPALIAAVEEGKIALYIAARVSTWSPEAQNEFVQQATASITTITLRRMTLALATPHP